MHVCIRLSFVPAVLDCPALTLQSSRSLDALSDLKLQRLEAELEGARHEAQGACQREDELKAECERLKDEMRQLQSNHRERVRVGVWRNLKLQDQRMCLKCPLMRSKKLNETYNLCKIPHLSQNYTNSKLHGEFNIILQIH